MVELRKRKAPPPAAEKPAKKPAVSKLAKTKDAVKEKIKSITKGGSSSTTAGTVGQTVDLATFGGEIETNDEEKVTLGQLVEKSKAGVVLFTYPKASTPGCTKQACLFRDSYTPLTATGLDIYGLSADSPKSNTTFKTKQNLQYPLLCDPSFSLIKAIGLHKAPGSTQRGVFVIGKDGKVLAAEPGSPQGTVDVVQRIVGEKGGESATGGIKSDGAEADGIPI